MVVGVARRTARRWLGRWRGGHLIFENLWISTVGVLSAKLPHLRTTGGRIKSEISQMYAIRTPDMYARYVHEMYTVCTRGVREMYARCTRDVREIDADCRSGAPLAHGTDRRQSDSSPQRSASCIGPRNVHVESWRATQVSRGGSMEPPLKQRLIVGDPPLCT